MEKTQLFYIIPSAIILSLSVSMAFIPLIIKMVNKLGLMDTPNDRSEHSTPTPTLGGIAIFLGFISVAIIFGHLIPKSLYLLAALVIIFACGLLDDIMDLSPIIKLIAGFGAAFLVCYADMRLKSFYGLFGIEEIPVYLQYIVSMFLIVGIMNAFNLIDGIDGLAGGIGVINAVLVGLLFLASDHMELGLISFALAGSLLGFLYYNFNPASIFMGDSGSLPVGFIFATLGIKLMETNVVINGATINQHTMSLMVVGILFLPVFDFIRVTIYRITKKQSPFKADKNHIHHLLVNIGFNHKTSTIILYLTNIILISLAFILRDFWIEISMALLFLISYMFLELMSIKKIKNIVGEMDSLKSDKSTMIKQNRLLDN